MIGSIFKAVGGLVGDTIEVVKYVGSEVTEIPSALGKGYQEGLMIETDKTPVKSNLEPIESESKTMDSETKSEETTDERDAYIAELEAKLKANSNQTWK